MKTKTLLKCFAKLQVFIIFASRNCITQMLPNRIWKQTSFIQKRNKKREQLISDIVKKHDLSLSAILRNHEPKFRSLIHFYSIDKLHLTSFDNEICSLSEEERKKFNYQLVIENDIENQLFAHQAMPKEKVLEIFKHYLSMTK